MIIPNKHSSSALITLLLSSTNGTLFLCIQQLLLENKFLVSLRSEKTSRDCVCCEKGAGRAERSSGAGLPTGTSVGSRTARQIAPCYHRDLGRK